MKNYGKVIGAKPQPLEINEKVVRLATNIKEITSTEPETEETITEYEFTLVEYTKDEYIKMLQGQITDTELAIVELYEGGIVNG